MYKALIIMALVLFDYYVPNFRVKLII